MLLMPSSSFVRTTTSDLRILPCLHLDAEEVSINLTSQEPKVQLDDSTLDALP